MCKLRKAAVGIAALGSVAILGAGTAHADGGPGGGSLFQIMQGSSCRSHDLGVDVLGEVGIVGGLQSTALGSSIGCNNSFGKK
ncbi:hypothetical protein ACGFOU_16710 [Streptomyces sp. NPDC048595]|uniref:hypothetical protein n=1 Tax=Streptomyces sp. NPDC048595 TaxID=3365576 RepID=UPI0037126B33